MKITKTIMITTVAFISMSLGGSLGSVNAASWHKGTPKTLVGKYKHGKSPRVGKQTWAILNVSKKTYDIQYHDMPRIHVKKVSYKKIGRNTYKLRGTGVHSGMYLGGKESMTIKKSGHNLKLGKLSFHRY